MSEFSEALTITLPTTSEIGDPCFARRAVVRQFCQRFGGATVTRADGAWVNATGALVEEKVVVIRSTFDSDGTDWLPWAVGIARVHAIRLGQDCILVEHVGTDGRIRRVFVEASA